MSDSVRPHRRQPTRLCRPWDSPGKNTGVVCHFLLQRMKVKSESEVTPSCWTLCDPMDCSPTGSSIHGIFQARILERGAIAFSVSSFRALVNISCIFSIVFPRPWIIFTIIILNYFSGWLPISTSFNYFSGVLSFPFIWDITFCFFILICFL